MEYLSRLFNTLKDNKEFSYHPRCAKLGVTHLCFADDLLLFGRGDLHSVVTIMNCFDIFAQASGLQANRGKSSIYFGGLSKKDRESIIQHTSFLHGQLPFKYLGIPLSTKKLILNQWMPLVDRIVAKINNMVSKKVILCWENTAVTDSALWYTIILVPTISHASKGT